MAIRDLVPWGPKGKKSLPVRREGDGIFFSLQREINQLFDDFFRGFSLEPFRDLGRAETFVPVDVSETDSEIRISAELPGMDEKDVEVVLDHDALTIKGEKKEEHEEKKEGYYRSERSFGSFQRTIPLPEEIDREKIEAEFKNGVLTVRMPKLPGAKTERKKIDVKGA